MKTTDQETRSLQESVSSGTSETTIGWSITAPFAVTASGGSVALAEVEDEEEDKDEEEEEESNLPTWESELAYEGLATSDGRYLIPGTISNRDLPLTLMCQTETAEGHMGAEVCGKITRIWREERDDLGEGVVAIMGAGEFADSMMGPQAAELVEAEVLRGVSVDLAPTRRVLLDAETKEEVAQEDFDLEKYANGEYLLGVEGELMGATLVPFPAFAQASMRTIKAEEEEAVVAAASSRISSWNVGDGVRLIQRTITASAAGIAPLRPPKDWFFTEEPEGKFPLTVDDDGRIYGHLATWDQCHHGFMNECVLARPSRADYAHFHVGAIKTAEGDLINVGRIVVGEAGHAPLDYGVSDTSRFYDKTGMVGAFVRAIDGKYGIWLSGAVRSDCPAEKVRDMLANPPSGDWRREDGWLELIAALSVPVPGFPVPRYEYALAASADTVDVSTLIATGYFEIEKPTLSRAELRRKELLLKEARS